MGFGLRQVNASLITANERGTYCVAPPCADPAVCTAEETAVVSAVGNLIGADFSEADCVQVRLRRL